MLEKLNSGVNAHDVKVDIRLSIINTKWIVDIFKFMKEFYFFTKMFDK